MKREPWTKERLLELLKESEAGHKHKQLADDNDCSIPRISQLLAKARKMQETVEA